MKRICLVHYAYPPKIGGVEKIMREHCLLLAKFGYQITVVTGSGEEESQAIELIVDEKLQAIKNYEPEMQTEITTGDLPNNFQALAQDIEKHLTKNFQDQDVVIVHNMLTLIHNLPFVAAFKSWAVKNPTKKIIVWVHDQTYIDNGEVVWEKVGVLLHEDLKKLLLEPLPNAQYVVISETFKKLLLEVMPISSAHIQVIPNGINIKRFLEIDPIIWNFMRSYHLESAFPIILAPGNILPRKNLEYSLEIIGQLKQKYPKFKFIISGLPSQHRNTHDYFDQLIELIKKLDISEHVIFLGDHIKRALSDAELHDLYTMADMIFFFTKQENFGLPLLEAALTKTPIFISDLAVFHEIAGDFLTYIDLKSPATKTAQLVANTLENNQLIKLNKLVREGYNLETIVKEKLVPLL